MATTIRQVANLRTSVRGHGSDESRQRAEAKNIAAAAIQPCPWAVAPDQRVVCPSGLVLTAGQEVKLEHLEGFTTQDVDPSSGRRIGAPRSVPAWRILERLVRTGVVLEANNPTPPRAA